MCHSPLTSVQTTVFTARRVCIVRICRGKMSVCPSVCLSHAGIVHKRIHISSNFFHHRVTPPFWLLSRVSILTRDIDIANLSVCLSVRPSVCPSVCPLRSGISWKRLNISSQFFSPYGGPIILVLPASNIFTKFRRGHPLRGAKYRWGRKNLRFSTNKSLYLANDTKYRHSYYGRRIGTSNSKSCMICPMVPFPVTLSDP